MNNIPLPPAPQNIDAEQALLGAILVNNDAFVSVSGFLHADHFFDPVHARIYAACASLIDKRQLASPVTLKSYFGRDDGLASVGGAAYLARLAGASAPVLNAEDYGRAIFDLALRRGLQQICEDGIARASAPDPGEAPIEIVQAIETQLYGLTAVEHTSEPRPLSHAMDLTLARLSSDKKAMGVPSGLADLDRHLGGFYAPGLFIIGGRPSMGKTALATTIAFNAAAHAPVLFVSLEMSADEIATRILASQTGAPVYKIKSGSLSDAEWRAICEAKIGLDARPLYIEEQGALSLSNIRHRARRLKAKRGLGMVVIDYLQLISGSDKYRANKVAEVTEISMGLKALAKELSVPVVALSQLSRGVEQRDDKRPKLSDLRESGSIEQDADVVMFVYREEYYLRNAEPTKGGPAELIAWADKMSKAKGKAQIICEKNRNGPVWTENFHFDGELCRFGDLQP